jgi:hypothetical protein
VNTAIPVQLLIGHVLVAILVEKYTVIFGSLCQETLLVRYPVFQGQIGHESINPEGLFERK